MGGLVIICGDRYHPAEVVMEGMAAITRDQVVRSSEPGWPSRPTSIVVLAKSNSTSADDDSPWASPASDDVVHEWVQAGGGLLVVHSGTVRYGCCPQIRRMTGGAFVRHPPPGPITILPVGDHRLSTGMLPFTVHDEHYIMETDEGSDVFLESRSEHGVQPAGWTKEVGKGKVCVITPGHFAGVWADPGFQEVVSRSLGWLTGA